MTHPPLIQTKKIKNKKKYTIYKEKVEKSQTKKKMGEGVRGSEARRKGKGMREKKERKGKKEKEGRKEKEEEKRKEKIRVIGTNVAQGAKSDGKGPGIVLREVCFLLLRLFYA